MNCPFINVCWYSWRNSKVHNCVFHRPISAMCTLLHYFCLYFITLFFTVSISSYCFYVHFITLFLLCIFHCTISTVCISSHYFYWVPFIILLLLCVSPKNFYQAYFIKILLLCIFDHTTFIMRISSHYFYNVHFIILLLKRAFHHTVFFTMHTSSHYLYNTHFITQLLLSGPHCLEITVPDGWLLNSNNSSVWSGPQRPGGQYHGGQRPSSDDSFHSPAIIPLFALDKPSIMKHYHHRRMCSHTSPCCSPTMITLHGTPFVQGR